jgi:hypothetical protein
MIQFFPWPFDTYHAQSSPPNSAVDPYYLTMSNLGYDAIYIAVVTISTQKISTGFHCGQSWFLSTNRTGATYATPKCVWFDGDRTNNINAMAVTFHINYLAP